MSQRPPPALVLQDVSKSYQGRPAVDRLGFEAPPGMITVLLGPNGAGKTTAMELCEGLRTVDSGDIEVLGLPPGHQALRARVGVLLQDVGVYGSVTPREALRHAAAMYQDPRDPSELLSLLGLNPVARTPFRRLSGGQQQRLGVALAFMGRPELMILDEPTAGLDPQARHLMWDLLTEYRRSGVTVVMSTHYLEEAEQLADFLVVIDHGRTLASGTLEELIGLRSHRVAFTAPPGLDLVQLQSALSGTGVAREDEPGHYTIESDQSNAVSVLSSWLAANAIIATSVTTSTRRLGDVYLELTGREVRS